MKSKMELKRNYFVTIDLIQEVVSKKLKDVPETDFSHAMEKLEGREVAQKVV